MRALARRLLIVTSTAIAYAVAAPITPVNSVATIQLMGSAGNGPGVQFSSGQPVSTPVTAAPGVTDTSASIASVNAADGFVDSINFGTLSNGDGTAEIATLTFRERGNARCHVSVSVASYVANNITYNGNPLTSSAASSAELAFIKLGYQPGTAGSEGNLGNLIYGPEFTSGTGTLGAINAGIIAPVSTTKSRFVSFSGPPSAAGSFNGQENWVEDTATFSCPTGLVWAPSGSGPSNWSTSVQFAMFTGP